MNAVDGSEHYERTIDDQSPSLLTIILDTNPLAWSGLSETLSLPTAVAHLLVFINAHLACNYTNKIAVIASHCTTAQWLYPSPSSQHHPKDVRRKRGQQDDLASSAAQDGLLEEPAKKLKINGPKHHSGSNGVQANKPSEAARRDTPSAGSNKYRPFRLVEQEVLQNLARLLTSTTTSDMSTSTSTMIAGALTLALSYINRESIAFADSQTGGGIISTANASSSSDPSSSASHALPSADSNRTGTLQSRILLVSVSPSTDLAHQYIPIMNAIFACQRLQVPIDICQIPLSLPPPPPSPSPSSTSTSAAGSSGPGPGPSATSTVFLQQASDATRGIYIPLPLQSSTRGDNNSLLLQYLLMAYLPSQSSRAHLVLPTRIDVDFRAACFCHRRIVDVGFVCSICLSIFCSVPADTDGDCLTCGTHLQLGDYGGRPIVVPRKKQKKKPRAPVDGNRASTPTPGPS